MLQCWSAWSRISTCLNELACFLQMSENQVMPKPSSELAQPVLHVASFRQRPPLTCSAPNPRHVGRLVHLLAAAQHLLFTVFSDAHSFGKAEQHQHIKLPHTHWQSIRAVPHAPQLCTGLCIIAPQQMVLSHKTTQTHLTCKAVIPACPSVTQTRIQTCFS